VACEWCARLLAGFTVRHWRFSCTSGARRRPTDCCGSTAIARAPRPARPSSCSLRRPAMGSSLRTTRRRRFGRPSRKHQWPRAGWRWHSLHMEGRAIDVRLPCVPLAELRDAGLSPRAGGVGFYPHDQFVHLDTGRRPRLVSGRGSAHFSPWPFSSPRPAPFSSLLPCPFPSPCGGCCLAACSRGGRSGCPT